MAGCTSADTSGAPKLLPLRSYMAGGLLYPEATGYWLHQYSEQDQVTRLLEDQGFECGPAPNPGKPANTLALSCQRSHRYLWGLMTRVDMATVRFRGNGSIEFAEAGCRYEFFDSPKRSGTCKQFVAQGAVFPDIDTFALTVYRMMLPSSRMDRVADVNAAATVPVESLRDAQDAVDRLRPWLFNCEAPRQHYQSGFRGNVGELHVLTCQQYSLHSINAWPQSQQVLIHYDSTDLAVRKVEVRLDDAAATLPPDLNTRESGATLPEEQRLQLENRNGERFDVPWKLVGTGSAKTTLEGFEALTPTSQRDLLNAYLQKMDKQWSAQPPTHLSYLNPSSLEWYGPQALPILNDLMSDDAPLVSAALLKHVCRQEAEADKPQGLTAIAHEPYRRMMTACFDHHRAALPRSMALTDHLLAQDLNDMVPSNAGALNAFANFREYILFVIALGPDARESGAALDAAIRNKEGLDPGLQTLIAEAHARMR